MRNFIFFILVTVGLASEITTYTPEEKEALNHYLKLAEDPDFRIDQHENFVNKTVDRVILAVNSNSRYVDYWPYVAKAWSRFIGVKPTLVYIGNQKLHFSQEVGEVIQIPPVKGISTVFQAQCVRLLAPALFPEEICVIADIDQFPFNAEFFHRPFEVLGEDAYIIYYSLFNVPKRAERIQFVMSYNAAKGKVFGEIFGVRNIKDIQATLKKWYYHHHKKYHYFTDQTLLFQYLNRWDKFNTHCYHLQREPLGNSLSTSILRTKNLVTPIPESTKKPNFTLKPEVIEDVWKGRYTEVYLQKGHTALNKLMYALFELDK